MKPNHVVLQANVAGAESEFNVAGAESEFQGCIEASGELSVPCNA